MLASCLRKGQREHDGGLEAHRLSRHHARVADSYREVGLPAARLIVEHEVLRDRVENVGVRVTP